MHGAHESLPRTPETLAGPFPALPGAGNGPLIIGHRGIPARRPENTLAGFDLAIELGADAIELDVHATRDGVVVVHHDPALPDGRAIANLELAVLHGDATTRDRMPPLSEVLSAVRDRATVLVEIKGRDIEPLVVGEVLRSNSRCAIHSFDHLAVRRVRDLAPSLPTGILLESRLVDTVGAMRAAAAATLWQEAGYIDEALVHEVRAHAGHVIAWTVNDPAEVRRLARLGVSGLCTDDVQAARVALQQS